MNVNKKTALFFILLFCSTCSPARKNSEFSYISKKTGNSSDLKRSRQRIDNTPTFELYFIPKKSFQCARFSLKCTMKPNKFTGKELFIRSFFIVEKRVNISAYTPRKKTSIFTSMGQNFDRNWDLKNPLILCSSYKDPLTKFSKGGLYRIRLSTLRSIPFTYHIEISSDSKIDINTAPPIQTKK